MAVPGRVEVRISVVVPAYDHAHLLPRVLESVLHQWRDGVELIVINDGSRDDTAKVLADFAARYPQLQVLHQDNAGAAAARNHGIRKARGRYVLLLDADDELLPDALDTLYKLSGDNPSAGMILGGQISAYPDGRERTHRPTAVPAGSPRQLMRWYLLEKRITISHCCSLFRRDLLLERPYPENLVRGEDIPVFSYLLVKAPVVTTDALLARIYKYPDSLRHNREREKENALRLVEDVFASLPKECQPLRRRYIAQRYLSLFRGARNDGDLALARKFYCRAFRTSPRQALRWTYMSKFMRLLVVRRWNFSGL